MIQKITSYQLIRYFAASGVALCIDYASYLLLTTTFEIAAPSAAVLGYCIGLAVSYYLLTQYVFKTRWLKKKRRLEVTLFLFSGILGVLLTFASATLYLNLIGQHLHGPKMFAVMISFFSVYIFRKAIVFRRYSPG